MVENIAASEQTTETNTEINQEQATAAQPEKSFTQAELNEIINKRLEKERKKQPAKEELAAFEAWKSSQQTEQEKQQELIKELDQLKTQYESELQEKQQAKNQFYLLQKGVPLEDLDYYAYKISKMQDEDTTFEKAAEAFLRDKQVHPAKQTVSVAFGAQQKLGTTQSLADRINNKLRGGI